LFEQASRFFARLLRRSHISRRIGENPQVPLGETLMVRENPPGQNIHVMVIELNDQYQRISRPPPIKFA
jgi:hypothetical protein